MLYHNFVAAIILIVPALAGISVMAWLKILTEKVSIFVSGAILGISAYATTAYGLAYIVPITPLSIFLELAVLLAIGIFSLYKGGGRNILHAKTDRIALFIFCVSLVFFFVIGGKLLIDRPDGMYTGIINAYGDVGWHAAIINAIAEQSTLPIENPIFAGERLTYPFLVNLISATMVVAGSSLTASIDVPAILLIPCLLVLIYLFAKQYGESKTAGVIACILFLFGGATFGWIQFFSDIKTSTTPIGSFLLALPAQDYSGVGTSTKGFHFLNPVTSLLLPQRAMLFGIPLVLSILLLLHPANIHRKYSALVAGILAGMLPLFHAHACIALAAGIIALVIAYPRKKEWLAFFAPALALGISEILFYMQGNATSGSFFRYGPYWMSGERNHILYWIQNTGAYIPISIAGLFLKAPKAAKTLALAGTFLFIIADTFLFAPWAWDNFKLFVFWFIFILPLVTWCFATALKKHSMPLLQISAVVLIIIHIFAGALDVYKLLLPTARTWQEWDTKGINIAEAMQTLVPAHDPVLTAPVHNSPAILAGRTIFLGYPAHIWSHGGLPWDREQAIKNYFSGIGETIDGKTPKYILVGPQERALVPTVVIRPSWSVLASYGDYTLYIAN